MPDTGWVTGWGFWPIRLRWTADNAIGYVHNVPVEKAIYSVSASGGEVQNLGTATHPSHPRWSSDGESIYLYQLGAIGFLTADGGRWKPILGSSEGGPLQDWAVGTGLAAGPTLPDKEDQGAPKPLKPWYQWLAGSALIVAVLLPTFKNPKRSHL